MAQRYGASFLSMDTSLPSVIRRAFRKALRTAEIMIMRYAARPTGPMVNRYWRYSLCTES